MKLFQKTILAMMLTALVPIASFAQTDEVSSASDLQAEITSYWAEKNDDALRAEFEESSLSWGAYLLSLGHEAEEPTNYSALFHAFTADFAKTYGIQPQNASIDQLRSYYAQRREGTYGWELLLPTMAVWKGYPMLSIIPLPDRLNEYWEKPQQAAKTYEFMASIHHEDTLDFMGHYLGSFYSHPTKEKVLQNFWKKWIDSSNSLAKQDVATLKHRMLSEILSHDAQYAVYELASEESHLWKQLFSKDITAEELSQVQRVLTEYCLPTSKEKEELARENKNYVPTENCVEFVKLAKDYKYLNKLSKDFQGQLSDVYDPQASTQSTVVDEIYNNTTIVVRVDPELVWYWDIWHPYYYWYGRIYRPWFTYDYRWWAYPWFWHRPPVIITYPGHHPGYHPHRPPHQGHRPHVGPNGPHHHGGTPGYHPNRPGSRPGDVHGRRPGHGNNRPGGNGGHGNNGNGRPGGNGGHGNNGHGGNGGHGNNNGHGGHGGNGGHDNGGVNNGHNNGGNPPNGGTINNGRTRPSGFDRKSDKGNAVIRDNKVDTRVNHGTTFEGNKNNGNVVPGNRVTTGTDNNKGHNTGNSTVTRPNTVIDRPARTETTKKPVNSGNIDRVIHDRPAPSTPRVKGNTGNYNGGSVRSYDGGSRNSGGRSSVTTPSTSTPSRSYNSGSSSVRSNGGFSGGSRSSGGFSGGSRSSGGFSGGSRSSGGGFSGGSHGGSGSSGGSHGGSGHGGRR